MGEHDENGMATSVLGGMEEAELGFITAATLQITSQHRHLYLLGW